MKVVLFLRSKYFYFVSKTNNVGMIFSSLSFSRQLMTIGRYIDLAMAI